MAQKKKTPSDLDIGIPGLSGFMTALNPVGTQAVMDLMSESAEFVTARVNSTVALQQDMMACRSPVEAMELQSAYMRETMQACTLEMSRFASLMMSGAGAVSKDAKEGHRRSYDDIPV